MRRLLHDGRLFGVNTARSSHPPKGVAVDTETGEILSQEQLWAAQNARLDGLKLTHNAIKLLRDERVAAFPVGRRTVARRRWQHRLVALGPVILMLLAIIFLAIWLHQPAPHCEPYMNC